MRIRPFSLMKSVDCLHLDHICPVGFQIRNLHFVVVSVIRSVTELDQLSGRQEIVLVSVQVEFGSRLGASGVVLLVGAARLEGKKYS